MKAASVAAETICTAAVRMPAKITGSASGISIRRHHLRVRQALAARRLDDVAVDLGRGRYTVFSSSAGRP